MTNREYLNALSDDDFAEWLCKQMYSYFGKPIVTLEDIERYHAVRNFLKADYPGDTQCS